MNAKLLAVFCIISSIFAKKLTNVKNSRHCNETTNPNTTKGNIDQIITTNIIKALLNMTTQLARLRSGLPRSRLEVSQGRFIGPLHKPKDLQLVKLVFKGLCIGYTSAELSVGADRSSDWIRCRSHESGLQQRLEGLSGYFYSPTVFRAAVGVIFDVGLVHETYVLMSVLTI